MACGSPAPRSSCCRCRCGWAPSRSSWPRPGVGSPTPTSTCWSSTRSSRPSSRCSRTTRRGSTFDELVGESGHPDVVPPDDPDRLAILQYTSGSTSEPKGVMLPDRTLCANIDALTTAGRLDQEGPDVFVSWLPLYHDMGLVGILTTAMAFGNELVLGAPQDFMASPSRWVEWMSTYGGTLTAAPNFAYVLAARAMERLDGLDLSLAAARHQRRRAGGRRDRASLHRGGRPARPASRGHVPGVRDGRGLHRRRVPRAAHRLAHRPRRQPGARDRALRRAGGRRCRGGAKPRPAGTCRARPRDAHRRSPRPARS